LGIAKQRSECVVVAPLEGEKLIGKSLLSCDVDEEFLSAGTLPRGVVEKVRPATFPAVEKIPGGVGLRCPRQAVAVKKGS